MESANRNTWVGSLIGGALVALLLVLMARKVIDHVPLYDELLHILSARELIASGKPAIADGLYERAQIFTRLVALSFQQFGSTPVTARLPALGFAVALLLLMSTWVARRAGTLAGVASAVVLCLVPATLELAVFARFYTFHAFVIALMGILCYEASLSTRSAMFRTVAGVAVLFLAALGLHLQETSIIAVGAFIAGLAAVVVSDRWAEVYSFLRRYPLQVAFAAVVLVTLGLAGAHVLGLAKRLSEAPQWASYATHKPQYYLFGFSDTMPLFWPVFPFVIVGALYFERRLAIFCLTMFVLTFLVHSVAAQKSVRYIYYALPFFCVVWGCGIAGLCSYVRSPVIGSQASSGLRFACTLLGVVTMLLISLEGQKALKTAAGKLKTHEVLSYAVEADWGPAVPTLKPLAAVASKLVTSNAMKSIYYLGGYDYELNASIVDETNSGREFGRDERTGRQAIGTAASMQKVLDMPGDKLIVLEQETLNLDSGVSSAALNVVKDHCKRVELPASAEISAWTC